MRRIDYYFSPLSPWTHLAGLEPARIARENGFELVYRPCDPGALFTRTGGKMLAERHESRQEYRWQELRRWIARRRVPMKLRPAFFPVNPAPAAYAIIAAQRRVEAGEGGDIHALVHGLTGACWERDLDIADDAVIGDCLEAAGFSRGLTMSGLLEGAEEYAANLERAALAGVFGFPFWVFEDGEKFWGQDRLDFFEEHAKATGA